MAVLRGLVLVLGHLSLVLGDAERWEHSQPSLPFCKGVADDVYKHTQIVPLTDGTFLPVYATPNKPEDIRQAVISIHGARRNANTYFCRALRGVIKAGLQESTLVVAPAFRAANLTAAYWLGDKDAKGESATWKTKWTQWANGGFSDTVENGVSSFEATDQLIAWITKTAPKLQRVYLTSFSAGAQMALRYSIMSPEGIDGKTTQGIPMRIIIGSPAFYTYLSDDRPDKSCLSFSNDAVANYWCDKWDTPPKTACEGGWNNYEYGLEELGAAACANTTSEACHASKYILKLEGHEPSMLQLQQNGTDTRASGEEGQTFRKLLSKRSKTFLSKDLRFIFGDEDVGPCMNKCEAMLQGENRLHRGLNFVGYMQHLYGEEKKVHYGLFHGGHNHKLFYKSKSFKKWIQLPENENDMHAEDQAEEEGVNSAAEDGGADAEKVDDEALEAAEDADAELDEDVTTSEVPEANAVTTAPPRSQQLRGSVRR